MKNTLNEIKDRIYEAEGLLELLQLRGDKLDDLLPLITMRLDEARSALATLGAKDRQEPAPAPVHVAEVAPEPVLVSAVQPMADNGDNEDNDDNGDDEPLYAVESEETAFLDGPAVKENDEPVADEKPVKVAKPAFCLNDRFRFRRSIFGGSDADFNAAMDHIATLDSYEEAEEIFYGEMELNPEDPDVIDFMNIIKEYFGR